MISQEATSPTNDTNIFGFNRGRTAAFFSVSQPGGCCNSNCPVEDLKLIGVGWNEENGFYTAEATGNVGTT